MAVTKKHIRKIRKKSSNLKKDFVSIPKEILDQALDEKSIEPIEDYLEDWEISHDPVILRRLEQAERDFATGNSISLDDLKKKLCSKSK